MVRLVLPAHNPSTMVCALLKPNQLMPRRRSSRPEPSTKRLPLTCRPAGSRQLRNQAGRATDLVWGRRGSAAAVGQLPKICHGKPGRGAGVAGGPCSILPPPVQLRYKCANGTDGGHYRMMRSACGNCRSQLRQSLQHPACLTLSCSDEAYHQHQRYFSLHCDAHSARPK